MPDKCLHQNKQNTSRGALNDLEASERKPHHADWIVTLAFYKALHAVDSYLSTFNIHPRGHKGRKGRNQRVKQYLQCIYADYMALHRASEKARYEEFTYEDDPTQVQELLKKSLCIEDHIKDRT